MTITGLAGSSFIWFRECLEAWLIIQIVWNIICRNCNNCDCTITGTQQKSIIVLSVFLALLCSVLLGYFAYDIIISDLKYVEAGTALVASALLLWTAWVCHGAHIHTKQIEQNIMTRGSLISLATVIFLTVFREGAEIVTFLSALYIAGTTATEIGVGAVVGISSLVVLGYFANHYLKKTPTRQIFKISKYLFTVLAIYFLYYGIHELVE